ncbi:pilus assembly protein PilM [Candidatus Margulisiibacteriota bacterium]
MGSILGIDLRVNSVKVVEIEQRKDGAVLKNWGLTEVPYSLVGKHPQKEDAQVDALRKLIQTRKIKTKEAAVVVGGSEVHVRLYTLEAISEAEAAQAIKWKFAEEIPFPIEEALIDFYALPKTDPSGKVDYVAACINLKLFQEMDYVVRKAGLKLLAVTILPDDLHKVFRREILKEKDKIVSLIYMGKRTTNISIFKGDSLEFNRELSIGGENITLAMSGVLVSGETRVEISPEESEKIKVEHGVPVDVEKYPKLADIPISQLQAMVRPALERIQDEIMRTFEYYKGQTGEAAIDKIVLTGGSSLTINLADFLSEGLGIPVVIPNAMEGRVFDGRLPDKPALEKILPRLTAALGSALVGEERINLLPEEIKHHWKILTQKFVKPQYLVSVFMVGLLLVYGAFYGWSMLLEKELAEIEQQMTEYRPRLAALDAMERTAKEAERQRLIKESYGKRRIKTPLVFSEIGRVIPLSVHVNVMHMTATQMHIWGTAFERRDTAENILSKFVIALSNSAYFDNVKLIQAAKNYDHVQDAFNFEIVADIVI